MRAGGRSGKLAINRLKDRKELDAAAIEPGGTVESTGRLPTPLQ